MLHVSAGGTTLLIRSFGGAQSGWDSIPLLENPEDGFHLRIRHRRVARRFLGPHGGEQGAQVRLGHLRTGFELTALLGETARASFGFVAVLARAPRLLPSGPQVGAELGHLATELDQTVDHRPAEIGIRGSARRRAPGRGPSRGLRGARLAGLATHGLLLGRIDRPGVQQAVGALRGFEPLARDQGPDGPRRGQRVGEPQLPADLGRGDVEHLAHLRPLGRRGQERVHPLQALLVHGAIMPDRGAGRPVRLSRTPGDGRLAHHG